MIFELVVVDTKKKAREAVPINTDIHLQRYVFVGESLCGVHHNGMRPNKLTINAISVNSAKEVAWYNEVLYPSVRISEQ